ncbi:MAG: hypothetical protein KF835_03460 [Xanthobacteraceae bacterium]|nr:hypothetical protein [Xanthobacteraceae bacterium]
MNFGIVPWKRKTAAGNSAAVLVWRKCRAVDAIVEYAETLHGQRHAVKDYFPIYI